VYDLLLERNYVIAIILRGASHLDLCYGLVYGTASQGTRDSSRSAPKRQHGL
jgi:hypothetical protein